MENGFRKAARTADVDTECCTASLRSFIVTVVSTMAPTDFTDTLGVV